MDIVNSLLITAFPGEQKGRRLIIGSYNMYTRIYLGSVGGEAQAVESAHGV